MGAIQARADLNRKIRNFFYNLNFLEVETPILVPSPGTDIFLDAFRTDFVSGDKTQAMYLQTSPEFAMKELLVKGCKRIYQLSKAFRNGERSERHNIEFTILEWYRAEESILSIINDVQDLVMATTHLQNSDFSTLSMSALIEHACGFDIRDAQTHASLKSALKKTVGLPYFCTSTSDEDWNDLFFDMMLRHVEPYLETLGAVFIVDWPARLAVLAQKNEKDPRVAERFELYIDGLEIANGFQELTDAKEQRLRFKQDNTERIALGKKPLPMPERFLKALDEGLPYSAGVALGVDRLLMVTTHEKDIGNFLPFAFELKD